VTGGAAASASSRGLSVAPSGPHLRGARSCPASRSTLAGRNPGWHPSFATRRPLIGRGRPWLTGLGWLSRLSRLVRGRSRHLGSLRCLGNIVLGSQQGRPETQYEASKQGKLLTHPCDLRVARLLPTSLSTTARAWTRSLNPCLMTLFAGQGRFFLV